MPMTCLQIVKTVCKRIGIDSPNAAVTSTDLQIQQVVALCEEEGQELSDRFPWENLRATATFNTVAAINQGDINTIAPGLRYIENDTIWNNSRRLPLYGPRTAPQWAEQSAYQINGPYNSYRISGDQLQIYPIPSAGEPINFSYISRNWIKQSGGNRSETWMADDDTPLIDAQLIIMGAIWRWKQAKGLTYAEDFSKYESKVAAATGRDGGKPDLNLLGDVNTVKPYVVIRAGDFAR